jgi:hypothetical protein
MYVLYIYMLMEVCCEYEIPEMISLNVIPFLNIESIVHVYFY